MSENNDRPMAEALPVEEPKTAGLPILCQDIAQIPLWQRPRNERWLRLGIIGFAMLMFLPNIGAFGLWDPWETHYGEVTRNMVESYDWISPWWGFKEKIGTEPINGEQFFSKPIFIFWVESLSLKTFGYSDFAIRLPVALLAIMTVFFLYWGLSKLLDRRVGVLGAVIMATCPMFFMTARQAQTDMPFVATMTVAMIFFLLAVFGPRQAQTDRQFWRRVALTVLLFLLSTLPQFGLLITDLRSSTNFDALPTMERIMNTIKQNGLWHVVLFYLPATVGLLAVLVVRWRRAYRRGRQSGQGLSDAYKDREMRNLYLYVFYILMAHSTLAKGLLGFMLPGFAIFVFLLLTWQWRLLWNWDIKTSVQGSLQFLKGVLMFVVVSFPWYAAMFAKFGQAFYTRFFVHDHFNRLGAGVHQIDTGTFEHFLKWLGIGTFPWVVFVPVAIVWLFQRKIRERTREGYIHLVLFLLAFLAYVVFTLSATKFHHYIFPALPPLVMLIASFLIDAVDHRTRLVKVGGVLAIGLFAALVFDLNADHQHLRNLMTYKYDRPMPEFLPLDAQDVVQAGSYTTWEDSEFFKNTTPLLQSLLTTPALRYERFMPFLSILGGVSLILFLFAGRAKTTEPGDGTSARRWGSWRTRLLGLFWRPRRVAIGGLCLTSTLLGLWSLNYYMPMLSPHWSQKYLFEALYDDCHLMENDPETDRAYTPLILHLGLDGLFDALGATKKRVCNEDVVSWLLTWRGETYYSYNEIQPINKEVSQFEAYLTQRNKGKTFYLFMERGKTGAMESKLNNFTSRIKKKGDSNFQQIDSWVVETVFDESQYFMLAKATPQHRKATAPESGQQVN